MFLYFITIEPRLITRHLLSGEKVQTEILLMAHRSGKRPGWCSCHKTQTGLTADCTVLISMIKVLVTDTSGLGEISCHYFYRAHKTQMATVRPHVMLLPEKDTSRKEKLSGVDNDQRRRCCAKVLEVIKDQGRNATWRQRK